MSKYTFIALTAGAASAALIGLASPAVAAPSGPTTGQDTSIIDSVSSTVSVDRLGAIDAVQRD